MTKEEKIKLLKRLFWSLQDDGIPQWKYYEIIEQMKTLFGELINQITNEEKNDEILKQIQQHYNKGIPLPDINKKDVDN